MRKNRIITALFAMTLAASAALSMPITANADYATSGGTVTFASYIVMDKQANVPNQKFTYSIEPYGDLATTMTSGTATIGYAQFTPGQDTYSSLQKMASTIGVKKQTTAGTDDYDAVEFDAANQKYARTTVTVDFSKVTFKDVGEFYYIIKEDSGTEPSVTYDATTTVMKVYVNYVTVNNVTSLGISGYVMYKAIPATANSVTTYTFQDGSNSTTDTKADGFVNNYETEDLNVKKVVSGNQASHDEYFPLTVTIENAKPNTIYNIDVVSHAQKETSINGASSTIHVNPNTMTADAYGRANATIWIQNNQYYTVQGIAKGTSYTVNEDKATMDKEGYTPSADVVGDVVNGAPNALVFGLYTSSKDNDTNTVQFNEDHTVSYNYQAGTASVALNGTWKQTDQKIIVTLTENGEQKEIDYEITPSGKDLKVSGTPTITTSYLSTISSTNVVMNGTNAEMAMDTATTNMIDTYITADSTVTYTNTKVGTIPTGVILNTAPYAIVVLAGFFGLFIFAKKRREEEAEEE